MKYKMYLCCVVARGIKERDLWLFFGGRTKITELPLSNSDEHAAVHCPITLYPMFWSRWPLHLAYFGSTHLQ